MMHMLSAIADYFITFFIIFFAVLLAHTISMLILINKMVTDLSNRAGYNYQRGRAEYVNEQEKQYRRKQV